MTLQDIHEMNEAAFELHQEKHMQERFDAASDDLRDALEALIAETQAQTQS